MKNTKSVIAAAIISCTIGIITILSVVVIMNLGKIRNDVAETEAVKEIDSNTIEFVDSGTVINFSDVFKGRQNEERKVIVVEQETSVYTDIEDDMIDHLDVEWLKMKQRVTYKGTGYFVVNLDSLTEDRIIQDDDAKTVTIKIDRPYLELVDIDPEKIIINEVEQGLLTWGDLKLSVTEYNAIETEIRQRMEESLNTSVNSTKAQQNGLLMVKDMYEPLVNAIDSDYSVIVEYYE